MSARQRWRQKRRHITLKIESNRFTHTCRNLMHLHMNSYNSTVVLFFLHIFSTRHEQWKKSMSMKSCSRHDEKEKRWKRRREREIQRFNKKKKKKRKTQQKIQHNRNNKTVTVTVRDFVCVCVSLYVIHCVREKDVPYTIKYKI